MPNQEALLVDELVVFRAVLEKGREKSQQLLAVADENPLDSNGFVRVGDEYLLWLVQGIEKHSKTYFENVEPFIIDHPPVIS